MNQVKQKNIDLKKFLIIFFSFVLLCFVATIFLVQNISFADNSNLNAEQVVKRSIYCKNIRSEKQFKQLLTSKWQSTKFVFTDRSAIVDFGYQHILKIEELDKERAAATYKNHGVPKIPFDMKLFVTTSEPKNIFGRWFVTDYSQAQTWYGLVKENENSPWLIYGWGNNNS
ncbi:MAG: hypothetical protein WC107_00815 [Patescibacteria group bacterium]